MEKNLAPAVAVRLLRELRRGRRMSQRHLADESGVDRAAVNRIENGRDARLSTWARLFEGMGYRLTLDVVETSEEAESLLIRNAGRRKDRQIAGLCTGKRRFW